MNRYSGNAIGIISGTNYVGHYSYNCTDDQHWKIITLENGYYRIDNKANGNSLDVGSGNYVYHYPWNELATWQWLIISEDCD